MKLARLREWRESQGLTQKELAAEARASEWTVVRAESGEEVLPNTARRLAEVMGVRVADLLEHPPVPLAETPGEAGPRIVQDSAHLTATGKLEAEGRVIKAVKEAAHEYTRGEISSDEFAGRVLGELETLPV